MKNYFAGIFFAVIGTVLCAILAPYVTGRDLIGYDFQSQILVGSIFGALVSAAAGLPQLLKGQHQPNPLLAEVGAGVTVTLAFWATECLLMPGTNAGFSVALAIAATTIGAWIGAWMWLGKRLLSPIA